MADNASPGTFHEDRYTSDKPADLQPGANEDAFGHHDVARALAEAVRAVKAPFTVGLFGPWGSGKTGVLFEARRLAQSSDKEVGFVVFDAWRYEDDALRRALLIDLVERLKAEGHTTRSFKSETILDELNTERIRPVPRLQANWRHSLRVLFSAAVAAALVFGAVALLPSLGVASADLPRFYAAIAGAVFVFVLTLAGQLLHVENIQIRTPKLEDPDQFERRFLELMDAVKRKRLVLAIDNLDRCAADRVTQMLAIIKTFLEPTQTKTELVFVIAADDHAIRRHLTAQELVASGGAPGSDQVEQAVDEYLRKFFNGAFRIGESLGEEIQSYTSDQLGRVFDAAEASDTQRQRIVSMVVSALRRNPRRIKQFANSLQLRLELLQARESSGRIRPPVSTEVDLVAKLLIFEERWPREYRQLVADSRLLSRWQAEARRVSWQAARDSDDAAAKAIGIPVDLLPFLRASQTVGNSRARAVIEFKQRADELHLPRLGDMEEALDVGDLDAVAQILDDVESESESLRRDYDEALVRHFHTQRRRDPAEAGETLRAVILVEKLGTHTPDATREVLQTALDDPTITPELMTAKLPALLAVALVLDDTYLGRLVVNYTDRIPHIEDDALKREAVVDLQHLADHLDRLDEKTLTAVMKVFGTDEPFNNVALHEAYMPLVEMDASLMPAGAPESAIDALEESGVVLGSDAYRLAVTAAKTRHANLTAHEDRLVTICCAAFRGQIEDDKETAQSLGEDLVLWMSELDDVSSNIAKEEARALVDVLASRGDVAQLTLRLASLLLDKVAETSATEVAAAVVNTYFDQGVDEALLAFTEERSRLSVPILAALRSRVAQLLTSSGSLEPVERSTRLLLELDDPSQAIAQCVQVTLEAGQVERARVIVRVAAGGLSQSERGDVADAVISAAESAAVGSKTAALAMLAELPAGVLTTTRVKQAVNTAVADIQTGQGHENARSLLDGLPDTVPGREIKERTISALATWLLTVTVGELGNMSPQLRFAVSYADVLPSDEREKLTEYVLAALSQGPGNAQALAPLLVGFGGVARTERRNSYVERLIAIERGQPQNHGVQRPILEAAAKLTGPRSVGLRQLKERIKELRNSGNELDRQLADTSETILGQR